MKTNYDIFIGKEVVVLDSKTIINKNIKGKIIDETKNTFTIQTDSNKKTVLKLNTIFKIDNVTITGDSILGRCDQRLKNKNKK